MNYILNLRMRSAHTKMQKCIQITTLFSEKYNYVYMNMYTKLHLHIGIILHNLHLYNYYISMYVDLNLIRPIHIMYI